MKKAIISAVIIIVACLFAACGKFSSSLPKREKPSETTEQGDNTQNSEEPSTEQGDNTQNSEEPSTEQGDNTQNSEEPSVPDYTFTDEISLSSNAHIREVYTDLQREYLCGPYYRDLPTEAAGAKELNKSVGTVFGWESENFGKFSLLLSETNDMKNAAVYKTDEKEITVYNLKVDTTYYWQVRAEKDGEIFGSDIAETHTEICSFRNINTGVQNMRDLGGKKTESGVIRQGLIYRSGRFNNNGTQTVEPFINEESIKYLTEVLGIKSEIDLRTVSNNEVGGLKVDSQKGYGVGVLGESVKYYQRPMSSNGNMLITETAQIKNVFELLADKNNYPVVFHCAIGTDRTGVIAFLVNAVLGASEEDLYRDYLLSNFSPIGSSRSPGTIDIYISTINGYQGACFAEKTAKYLNGIGVSENTIRVIRELMLETRKDDKNHVVEFISEGSAEKVAYKNVREGYEVEEYIPSRAGYNFGGWKTNDGTDFVFGKYNFNEDVSVNAVWLKNNEDLFWEESENDGFSTNKSLENVFTTGESAVEIVGDETAADGYSLKVVAKNDSGIGIRISETTAESGIVLRIKANGTLEFSINGKNQKQMTFYGNTYTMTELSDIVDEKPETLTITFKGVADGYKSRFFIDSAIISDDIEYNYDFSSIDDYDFLKVGAYNKYLSCEIVPEEDAKDGYALKTVTVNSSSGSGVTVYFDDLVVSDYSAIIVRIKNTKSNICLGINDTYCAFPNYAQYTEVDLLQYFGDKIAGTTLSSVSFYRNSVSGIEIYIDSIKLRKAFKDFDSLDYDFSSPEDDDIYAVQYINGAIGSGIVNDDKASDGYAVKATTVYGKDSGLLIDFHGKNLSDYLSIKITFRAFNTKNPSQHGVGVQVYSEKDGTWINAAKWGARTEYETVDLKTILEENGDATLTKFRIVRDSVSNIDIYVDGVVFTANIL